LADGVLAVLRLLHPGIREAGGEPQDRDTKRIDDAGVDLAVRGIVRNHLTAAGEIHRRAVEPPIVILQRLAVPAHAVEALDAAAEPESRRGPFPAAELDVIAP